MSGRPIAAGSLRHRITIQRRVDGADSLGQASTTWDQVAIVRADAAPLTGREFFAAGQVHAEAEVRFLIRWRGDVTPSMRVLWRSKAYDILETRDLDGTGKGLVLMCASGGRDSHP